MFHILLSFKNISNQMSVAYHNLDITKNMQNVYKFQVVETAVGQLFSYCMKTFLKSVPKVFMNTPEQRFMQQKSIHVLNP